MNEDLQKLIVWGEERGEVVKLFTEGDNWVVHVGPVDGVAPSLDVAAGRAVEIMKRYL